MKEKILKYVKEFVLFIIILAVTTNLISFYRSGSLNSEPLHINNFKVLNGDVYTLDRTKPKLVHIWATWCPTCKLEASNIEFLSKHFQVITFAVKSGSNQEIQTWMDAHHYTFKVVNDSDGQISHSFKTFAYPSTFIYDKDGKLKFSDVGYTSTLGLYLRMIWSDF